MADRLRPGGYKGELPKMSALFGFPNHSATHLKWSIPHLKFAIAPRRPPATEKGLMKFLLESMFEGISEDRVKEICALREINVAEECVANAGNFLNENIEVLEGICEEQELDYIEKVVKESREKRDRAARSGIRPSRVGMRCVPRASDIDLVDARALAPPVGLLEKDTVLHWRWKGTFPKEKPNICSKSWGGKDHFTEAQALRIVLRQMWAWFVASDEGFACPFDIDEPIVGEG